MTEHLDVAIVGAGPFGLSVAACVRDDVRVFGESMKTWATTMPRDMLLRSAWSETSLAAPGGAGTIESWAACEGIAITGPIPLETFLSYAEWFRQQFVHDHDPADIVGVERTRDSFRLRTSAGDELAARRLVVAVGVTPFPYAPPAFAGVDDPRVCFATEVTDHLHLAGRRVLVLGGGQAALESAGLAGRAGANVELVSRSPIRWFADREPDRPRSPARQRLYRLAYPAVGYGPPPLNRLVLHPDLYAQLPSQLKRRLTARLLRPGGSPWLRTLVDGHVSVTEGRTVDAVEPGPDDIRLALSDGSSRNIDAVIVATGYRCDLRRLTFLDRKLSDGLRLDDGWPELDRHFRSSDPALFFVGYPAEGRFGPISRFVLGTRFTANRVAGALRAT